MIDCDVHVEVRDLSVLYPFLPDHWVDYCRESAFVGPDANDYPPGLPTSGREGASLYPDLAEVRSLLGTERDIAVLNPSYRVQSVRNLDLACSLASAVNQWQVDAYLSQDSRLRGSIVVPSQHPGLAAEEVERWAGHPSFVQVVVPVRSESPYGNRRYDPLLDVVSASDLVLAVQFGGAPGIPPTPSGWPSLYVEEYVGMAQVFQSQVISLVIEGAFDRYPALRVLLLESGCSWMPSLMWRMDKEWKGLRHNTPWVDRFPSVYMREHFWLSVQPLDLPRHVDALVDFGEGLGGFGMLVYGSDYPHGHGWYVEPLIRSLGDVTSAIFDANARRLYRMD